jgi:GMP synthase-like glutamine amidotransferase
MAKKILVLQFRTDVSKEHEKICIPKMSEQSQDLFEFVDIYEKDFNYENLLEKIKNEKQAIIFAGSGEYYIGSENDTPEMQARVDHMRENICPIIDYVIENKYPLLGICFGHQLLAKCRGGDVAHDEAQAESGGFQVYINEEGKNASIFKDMPEEFNVVQGHKDCVNRVPDGVKVIGEAKDCKVQVIQYNNNAYTVQFHPELDMQGLKDRFDLYPSYLPQGEISNPDTKVTLAKKILTNFIDISRETGYLN